MIKKKNILFICSDPAPGMIPFVTNLIKSFSLNVEYKIFVLAVSKGQMSYKPFLNGIIRDNQIFHIESSSNQFISFIDKIYPFKVKKLLRYICSEHKIHGIHCLTTEFTMALILPKIQKTIPIIYSVHDLVKHELKQKKIKDKIVFFLHDYGVSRNIKKLNLFSTSSHEQFTEFKKKHPLKKIFFHSFPSLVTDKIKSGETISSELKGVKNYILFFGSINVYKGVENLYNTFINNQDLYIKYHLVIAGKGDMYFKRNIEKENKIIRINRFIEECEIKRLFSNASAVVFPYTSATQSGVLSLAYFFQTPLVVSDVEFFKNNVCNNKTAFVFNRNDKYDLYSKLKAVLVSNKSAMANEQRLLYDKLYSNTQLRQDLLKIYNSLF